jgi:hypothetical protein
MATGDQNDIAQRLSSYLPTRWFGTILDTLLLAFINAVLQGTTACLSFLYSLYAYAKLQARIATATDGWLDLISADFFGNTLPRIPGEIDNSYRARIRARLVQEKATRSAISQAVQQLTGYAPQIFEPWRPADTGAYNSPQSLAYGIAGGYGSLDLPAQYFITAFRPHAVEGIANVMGYGIPVGAYNTPSQIAYISLDEWDAAISDAAIYAVIAQATAAGVIAWTSIRDFDSTGEFFTDNHGVLQISGTVNYPSSIVGLPPGAIWSNTGVLCVVPGITPNPAAPGVFLGLISPDVLLLLGGGNLPITNPNHPYQFWNNGGVICVS